MANIKKENEELKKTSTKAKKNGTAKKNSTTKSKTSAKSSSVKTKKTVPVTKAKKDSTPKEFKEPKKQILEVTDVLEEPKNIAKEDELAKTVILEDLFKIERKNAVNHRLVIYLVIFALTILVGGFCYIYDFLKEENNPKESYNLDEYFDENGNLKKVEEKEVSSSNYQNIKEITIEEYQMRLEHKEKMIVLIASNKCNICKNYEPILNEVLEEENINAYKIDIANFTKTEESELFNSLFNITGVPVTFVIENGSIKTSQVGSKNKDITKEFINSNY